MINSITVFNVESGNDLELNLRHPDINGLAITDVTGLGAPEATINMTEMANLDGGIFNSAFVQTRSIVLTVTYVDTSNISYSRRLLYSHFPIKKPVVLSFKTSEGMYSIGGFVRSNVQTVFSNATSASIEVVCPNPYFEFFSDETKTEFDLSAVSDNWTFPFYFSDISPTVGSYSLSSFDTMASTDIEYHGSVSSGMVISIDVVAPVSEITLYQVGKTNEIRIKRSLLAGDRVTISTSSGERSVVLTRDDVDINILHEATITSWFTLNPGETFKFAYAVTNGNVQDIYVTATIRHLVAGL